MDQQILISTDKFLLPRFQPSVVTWNRLEGRPRREDFDRSLRAEIRDALWMLTRQWQFGEFQGEDAGSAILAQIQVDSTRLNKFAVREKEAVGYEDSVPLEARVEAEQVLPDLRTRIQIGRHWLRLLKQGENLVPHYARYLSNSNYQFKLPEIPELRAHLESDTHAHQMFKAVQGRVVDGYRLLLDIARGNHNQFVDTNIPAGSSRAALKTAASELLAWFNRVYYSPIGQEELAWASDYLEYQFACSAPGHESDDQPIVLTADQYHYGNLEWYAFDRDGRKGARLESDGATVFPPSRSRSDDPRALIPSPVEFAGMPSMRWWEFEDGKTDFGSLTASTTDLATLVLAEFGLIYSNDWIVLPYDLEVGSLSKVRGIIITDVFGVKTLIRPAPSLTESKEQHWCMYNLTNYEESDHKPSEIFLAPTIAKIQEGQPIERVLLARDEMANMVWGVEDIIPGVLGTGTRGGQAANNLDKYLKKDQPDRVRANQKNDAEIQYKLGTTVPENWIPFIAVHSPGSNREVRLQRAAMPRFGNQEVNETNETVEPRGQILRDGISVGNDLKHYFIHEEEVPRAGATVTRAFQRARWWDGKIYTWLGRRKRSGKGEASSGLEFDQIVPIDKSEDIDT